MVGVSGKRHDLNDVEVVQRWKTDEALLCFALQIPVVIRTLPTLADARVDSFDAVTLFVTAVSPRDTGPEWLVSRLRAAMLAGLDVVAGHFPVQSHSGPVQCQGSLTLVPIRRGKRRYQPRSLVH